MKLNKKSEGLSITTVIIAVLALVVLIVLILIFTGKIDLFNKGVVDCGGSNVKRCTVACDACTQCTGTAGGCFDIPVKVGQEKSTGDMIYCCKAAPTATQSPAGA